MDSLQKRQQKAAKIGRILDDLYPETPIPLDHSDPYTLLIAVLLSAQSTDKRVNLITPALFAKASTPEQMVKLAVAEIREMIRSIGLAPRKSQNIYDLSHILLNQHDGQVPQTFAELEALPGVGHKTASVIMNQAFGFPAFPVDTHIQRLATRWGLSDSKNVKKTEAYLKEVFPEELWGKRHLQMIFFGREHCPSRRHDQATCLICSKFGNNEG